MRTISGLENTERVRLGKLRESHIADALKDQVGLRIVEASDRDDKERAKVDRWIDDNGHLVGLQIKFRETGDDLLFEVFDKWHGWDDPRNKLGRDLIGEAELYAVLKPDKRTIVMVPTAWAKNLINTLVSLARQFGWTVENANGKTFRYFKAGSKVELKVQRDPRDGRQKMVCYIPAAVFESEQQAKVYDVRLPKLKAA